MSSDERSEHNPRGIPASALGVGWRFMTKGELKAQCPKMKERMQFWHATRMQWSGRVGGVVYDAYDTFRVPVDVEKLDPSKYPSTHKVVIDAIMRAQL